MSGDWPPGSSTFSIEGRPAAGLYLLAWLLSAGGVAMMFIGGIAGPPIVGPMLVLGLVALGLGLSAGAGYQVLARRRRTEQGYRGPSPLIVFGVFFVLVNLGGVVLLIAGLADTQQPATFVAVGLLQLAIYAFVVWLFAVRTGALRWTEMGLTGRTAARQLTADAVFGMSVMFPATFAVLLLAGLIALLLQTGAPQVVPPPQTAAETLAVAVLAVLLIPLGEEIFFRGFALSAWLRDLGPRRALVRSTAFFAAVHIANVQAATFDEGVRQAVLVLAVIVPVGAVLGWLFLRRGLAAAIAGHVTYNGVLIALMLFARTIPAPTT